MDLTAYMQIEDLSEIARKNNIEVPRLRGYRLMADEEPVTKEDIEELVKQAAIDVCKDLCSTRPIWNEHADWSVYDGYTRYVEKYFMHEDEEGNRYLIIHSGSRNLGLQVAKIYQKKAIDSCKNSAQAERENKIAQLKSQGKISAIPDAIAEINAIVLFTFFIKTSPFQVSGFDLVFRTVSVIKL